MFTSVSHYYSLARPIQHIYDIFPAFDRSLVVFAKQQQENKGVLLHFNRKGQNVFKFVTNFSSNSAMMIDDRKAAVFSIKDNQITIVDLKFQTIKRFFHKYISLCKTTLTVYLFTETDIFCLVERQVSKVFTITYYKMNQELQKIKRYSAQKGEFVFKDWVAKGNNHSMIIWGKNQQKQELKLYVYQLHELKHDQEMLRVVVIPSLQFYARFGNSQLTLINMWQSQKGNLIAVCKTDQTREGKVIEIVSINIIKSILKSSKFHIQDNCILPLIFNLGDYSIFPIFRFRQGRAIQSPIYFIENASERIVSQTSWTYNSSHHLNLTISRNKVLMSEYPCEGEVKQLRITQLKIDYASIYVQFMLQLNQDFDDDLLFDAIQILL